MATAMKHFSTRSRVALLTNIPAPYRLPMFRKLSEFTELKVFFDARSESNRSWAIPSDLGISYEISRAITLPYWRTRQENGLRDKRYLQLNLSILIGLHNFQPDIVVSAELGPRTMQAAAFCALHKIPLIVWWEGTAHTEGSVASLKRWIRPRLLRRVARCWVNGVESAELLARYGVSIDRIDRGLIGVDTAFFADEGRRLLPRREQIRNDLNVTGTVFLFVGQLVERKGINQLVSALQRLAARKVPPGSYSVVVVGDGPLEGRLREWQAANPKIQLRLFPFEQSAGIPRFYAASDVFLLPTLDDNWSLVALEAAVSGLPQLFSPYNGVTSDLFVSGAWGKRVDPYDAENFADALQCWIGAPPPRLKPSAVQRLAHTFGPEQFCSRAQQSIDRALGMESSVAAFSS